MPIEVTIFNFSKSFTEGNLSAFEPRKFNYPLREKVIEVPTEYFLQLTSISSTAEGSFNFNLKSMILGITAH